MSHYERELLAHFEHSDLFILSTYIFLLAALIKKTLSGSSRPEVLSKKGFLEISQNSQENTCAKDSFLIKLQGQTCTFIKKETLAQVFSCEFCEISKNTFLYRTPLVAASVSPNIGCLLFLNLPRKKQFYISLFHD